MLGGFHLNDRRYADDDLTLGSIDPYQVFRIFHEILSYDAEPGNRSQIAIMIDQSHNLKGKVEAMVQTVATAQELYAKAALVDLEQLDTLQRQCKLVEAEELFRSAFWEDVRPLVRAWRARPGFAGRSPASSCARAATWNESPASGRPGMRLRYYLRYAEGCNGAMTAGPVERLRGADLLR